MRQKCIGDCDESAVHSGAEVKAVSHHRWSTLGVLDFELLPYDCQVRGHEDKDAYSICCRRFGNKTVCPYWV